MITLDIKEVAKKLGLSEEATEEEILAKIEKDQEENTQLKKTNDTLVETNKTLATSEAGKQARIDELEKTIREQSERQVIEDDKTPKSDIERLVEIK